MDKFAAVLFGGFCLMVTGVTALLIAALVALPLAAFIAHQMPDGTSWRVRFFRTLPSIFALTAGLAVVLLTGLGQYPQPR